MAFNAISGLTPVWFEPERWEANEKGELVEIEPELNEGEELTAVQIKPLDGGSYFDVLQHPNSTGIKMACRLGVVGWKNFTDGKGEEIEFSRTKINELIPAKYQLVIGTKIISMSDFDGEKQKNS